MALDLRIHPETEALVEELRKVPFGRTVEYSYLSNTIGIDVTGNGRPRLTSARRIAQRDFGAIFEVIYGVGLRRLPAEEVANIGAASRRKIRRASNSARSAMRALVEHSNGLSPDVERRMSAEMSVHGLISHIASDKSTGAIEIEHERPVASARVAESFLKHLRS